MPVFGKPLAVAVGAVALSGAAMVPFAYALADAHEIPQSAQVVAAAAATPVVPTEVLVVEQPPAVEEADAPEAPVPAPAAPASQVVDAELTCLAKVVLHESGNQSRTGQMAVAQVVLNRLNDPRGRFGRTICGVVMQRGQFFNVHAYNPRRDARWHRAVEVAREARDGNAAPVIGGALFFHAAYANVSFRGRTRVGRIGDHVFYQ